MKKLYKNHDLPYMLWLKNALLFALLIFCLQQNANASCKAGFTYTILNNEVIFKNTSTNSSGNPLKYFWNFGDDLLNYDGTDIKHRYQSNGDFIVTLNVYDTIANCHSIYTDTVTFNFVYTYNCKADFEAYFYAYTLDVAFCSKSSNYLYTYYWDFGDSITTNKNDTSRKTCRLHTYNNYGTYNVCHVVRDSINGCFDTIYKQITITKPADLDSCKADISYNDNGKGQVSFQAHATCGRWKPANYFWDFGNGDTSTLLNPTYSYTTGGPHKVMLVVNGSGAAKPDTVVKYIMLNSNCKAVYYLQSDRLKIDYGVQIYLRPSTKFEIDFGDGTKISKLNGKDSTIWHTYINGGIYTICYKRYDTLFKCGDTVCFDVKVNQPVWCRSNFNTVPTSYSRQINVGIDSAFAGMYNSFYEWNFGDGVIDTGIGKSVTSHLYAKDSTYKITLKVINTKGCTSVNSKFVVVKYEKRPCELRGRVSIDNINLADSAIVYLIQLDDSINHTLTLIDSTVVVNDTSRNTNYKFTDVPTGKYMVKAALARNSQFFQIFFPTYYATYLKWNDANSFYIINGYTELYYADINLKIGTNPGGPGFIGGKISAGANKKEGDPVENIQIMLFDADKNPVTYTYSDAKGNFKFENIALGTYEIYTEVIGLETNSGFVTISQSNPREENVQVTVSSKGISTSIPFKLGKEFLQETMLYPNPAHSNLYLEANVKKAQNAEILIYDMTGRKISDQHICLLQGNQIINIDTDNFPAGAYMLMLKNALGEAELNYKFIKN
ncbi:MAG: PKD domain-containing protein [Pedobacter sp.]|nr:MAG: PKD domain-containing protein [Pedobacter sp.]